jgi:hypothetical protein
LIKSIICVWTKKYHPNHKPIIDIGIGLGDMIRGAMGLFEYCHKNNHNFYLDIQLHPISNILDLAPSPFADVVKKSKDEIKFLPHPDKVIEESNDEIFLIACNFCPYEDFSFEAKQFMLQVLTPRKWVSDILNAQLAQLNLQQYNILHLRCGDNEFLNQRNSWKRFVAKQIIKENYEIGDLLLTDSVRLKSEMKTNNNLKIFTDTAIHLAHEFDSTSLLNTMLEFFAITRASKIKAYNRYSHLSGFVYLPSLIYGIPFKIMKMPCHIRMLDVIYNLTALYIDKILKLFKLNAISR